MPPLSTTSTIPEVIPVCFLVACAFFDDASAIIPSKLKKGKMLCFVFKINFNFILSTKYKIGNYNIYLSCLQLSLLLHQNQNPRR